MSLTSGAMCETWPIEKFSGEYLVTGSSAGEHSSGYKSFPTLEEAEDYLFDLHRGGFAHSDFVDEPSVFDE